MSATPAGWIIKWENGHLWSDGHGNAVMLRDEPSVDFLASLGRDARAVPVVRFRPTPKKPHERGTA